MPLMPIMNHAQVESEGEMGSIKPFVTDCVIVGTGPAGGSLASFLGVHGRFERVFHAWNIAIDRACRHQRYHY